MQRLIPEIINERKVWMITSTREEGCEKNELQIIKPMIEKLNEKWHDKGNFVWAGRLDEDKTSMQSLRQQKKKITISLNNTEQFVEIP